MSLRPREMRERGACSSRTRKGPLRGLSPLHLNVNPSNPESAYFPIAIESSDVRILRRHPLDLRWMRACAGLTITKSLFPTTNWELRVGAVGSWKDRLWCGVYRFFLLEGARPVKFLSKVKLTAHTTIGIAMMPGIHTSKGFGRLKTICVP